MAEDDERRSRGLRGRIRRLIRRVARGPQAPTGPAQISFNGREPVTVPHGITVLHAATRADVDISHYCGGMASCGTCRIEIDEGAGALSPIEAREQMVLGYESASAGSRLACQARILGPVSVKVPRWF
ncbi:MAG: ferredoxin [Myxococcota bacterium]